MREITLTVYCDACIAQGSTMALGEAESHNVKLSIDGKDHRELDLCSACMTDFVNMSRADTAVKAEPKKKKGKSPWHYTVDYGFDSGNGLLPWTCKICDKQSATEQGIKQHLSLAHKDFIRA